MTGGIWIRSGETARRIRPSTQHLLEVQHLENGLIGKQSRHPSRTESRHCPAAGTADAARVSATRLRNFLQTNLAGVMRARNQASTRPQICHVHYVAVEINVHGKEQVSTTILSKSKDYMVPLL